MKFCENCGTQLPDESVFCACCGNHVSVAAPSEEAGAAVVTPVASKKKPNKKKLGIIIGAAALALVIGIGAAVGLGWYFGDEQKLSRAMKAGDLGAVKELVSENSDLRDNEELEEMLLNRIEELKTKVADGSVSCQDAEKELDTIERIKIKSVNKKVPAIREYVAQMKQSKEYFEKAEELFGKEDYLDAAELYLKVIEQDSNYETAQSKVQECMDKYRDKMLKTAADLAAAGKYSEAIAALNEAKWALGADQAIQDQIDAYKKAQQDAANQKKKEDTLASAEKYAASGNYTQALNVLESFENLYGEDSDISAAYDRYKQRYIEDVLEDAAAEAEDGNYRQAYSILKEAQEYVQDAKLNEKREEYKDAYVAEICEQADEMLANKQYTSAKQIVQAGLNLLPGDPTLTEKMKQIDLAQPVGLDTLELINGDFKWNEGNPADPFGNAYTGMQNFAILHSSHYDTGSMRSSFVEYRTDNKYKCLSFNVVPYSEFGANSEAYVQVFVDGVLRYTSTKIIRKSDPVTISEIDISDATYVKLVVYGNGWGCVMISDVIVSNPVGFISKLKTGYTSLSELYTFNGSMYWENEYPSDTRNNNYTGVQNYSVIHSSHYSTGSVRVTSAEYYVACNYDSISLNIASAADFGEGSTAVVKIYVDDILIYTSKTLSKKTEKFSTGEISLAGADYVKIVVEGTGYGCVIISDALLKNAE